MLIWSNVLTSHSLTFFRSMFLTTHQGHNVILLWDAMHKSRITLFNHIFKNCLALLIFFLMGIKCWAINLAFTTLRQEDSCYLMGRTPGTKLLFLTQSAWIQVCFIWSSQISITDSTDRLKSKDWMKKNRWLVSSLAHKSYSNNHLFFVCRMRASPLLHSISLSAI